MHRLFETLQSKPRTPSIFEIESTLTAYQLLTNAVEGLLFKEAVHDAYLMFVE